MRRRAWNVSGGLFVGAIAACSLLWSAQPQMAIGDTPGRSGESDAQDKIESRLSPAMVDKVIEVASEVDEDLARQLRGACELDPREFERVLRTSGRRLVGLVQLKERDPDLYELKIQEFRVESRIKHLCSAIDEARASGNEAHAQRLTEELRGQVRLQVAFSLKSRGDYLKRLEAHVEALREKIHQDSANFDEIVESRLVGCVGPADSSSEKD